MEYKSRLKHIRESKGMTQSELSKKSGVNLRMIQNYEQGAKDINKAQVITVLQLTAALGCNIYELINVKDVVSKQLNLK